MINPYVITVGRLNLIPHIKTLCSLSTRKKRQSSFASDTQQPLNKWFDDWSTMISRVSVSREREIYTWRVWSCCVWLEWIMWQSLQELIPLDVSHYPQNSNSVFAEETLQNDCDSCFYLAGVTFYTYWWGEIIRTDVNIRWNMALRAQRNSTGLLRTRFSSSEESCWPQSLYTETEPSLKLVFPIRTLRSTALPSRASSWACLMMSLSWSSCLRPIRYPFPP